MRRLSLLIAHFCLIAIIFTITTLTMSAQEVVTGTLHVVWLHQVTVYNPGNGPSNGYWVNLHSDDTSTVSFSVVLRYRVAASDPWTTINRTVDNDTSGSALGYWVLNPGQCIFWVTQWPSEAEYYVVENKLASFKPVTF